MNHDNQYKQLPKIYHKFYQIPNYNQENETNTDHIKHFTCEIGINNDGNYGNYSKSDQVNANNEFNMEDKNKTSRLININNFEKLQYGNDNKKNSKVVKIELEQKNALNSKNDYDIYNDDDFEKVEQFVLRNFNEEDNNKSENIMILQEEAINLKKKIEAYLNKDKTRAVSETSAQKQNEYKDQSTEPNEKECKPIKQNQKSPNVSMKQDKSSIRMANSPKKFNQVTFQLKDDDKKVYDLNLTDTKIDNDQQDVITLLNKDINYQVDKKNNPKEGCDTISESNITKILQDAHNSRFNSILDNSKKLLMELKEMTSNKSNNALKSNNNNNYTVHILDLSKSNSSSKSMQDSAASSDFQKSINLQENRYLAKEIVNLQISDFNLDISQYSNIHTRTFLSSRYSNSPIPFSIPDITQDNNYQSSIPLSMKSGQSSDIHLSNITPSKGLAKTQEKVDIISLSPMTKYSIFQDSTSYRVNEVSIKKIELASTTGAEISSYVNLLNVFDKEKIAGNHNPFETPRDFPKPSKELNISNGIKSHISNMSNDKNSQNEEFHPAIFTSILIPNNSTINSTEYNKAQSFSVNNNNQSNRECNEIQGICNRSDRVSYFLNQSSNGYHYQSKLNSNLLFDKIDTNSNNDQFHSILCSQSESKIKANDYSTKSSNIYHIQKGFVNSHINYLDQLTQNEKQGLRIKNIQIPIKKEAKKTIIRYGVDQSHRLARILQGTNGDVQKDMIKNNKELEELKENKDHINNTNVDFVSKTIRNAFLKENTKSKELSFSEMIIPKNEHSIIGSDNQKYEQNEKNKFGYKNRKINSSPSKKLEKVRTESNHKKLNDLPIQEKNKQKMESKSIDKKPRLSEKDQHNLKKDNISKDNKFYDKGRRGLNKNIDQLIGNNTSEPNTNRNQKKSAKKHDSEGIKITSVDFQLANRKESKNHSIMDSFKKMNSITEHDNKKIQKILDYDSQDETKSDISTNINNRVSSIVRHQDKNDQKARMNNINNNLSNFTNYMKQICQKPNANLKIISLNLDESSKQIDNPQISNINNSNLRSPQHRKTEFKVDNSHDRGNRKINSSDGNNTGYNDRNGIVLKSNQKKSGVENTNKQQQQNSDLIGSSNLKEGKSLKKSLKKSPKMLNIVVSNEEILHKARNKQGIQLSCNLLPKFQGIDNNIGQITLPTGQDDNEKPINNLEGYANQNQFQETAYFNGEINLIKDGSPNAKESNDHYKKNLSQSSQKNSKNKLNIKIDSCSSPSCETEANQIHKIKLELVETKKYKNSMVSPNAKILPKKQDMIEGRQISKEISSNSSIWQNKQRSASKK